MIQCKMFFFCFVFLHFDSLNIGKTHAWEIKKTNNKKRELFADGIT